MKRIFIFTFALLMSLSVSAQDNTIRLTVSGEGVTKEEATANALRSAIEQAFGTFVSANTQILNDDIVKDEIATISSGNIQEYTELGCITMPDGSKSVSLSATVSIGNLISYSKSKGSSAEFAGAVFAMNMKMRKLNAENEKKAVEHLRNQIEILAPDLFQIKISISGSYVRKHMSDSDFSALKAFNLNADPGVNYYLIPLKFNYYSSETSKAFYSLLLNTLQSLALSQSEIEEYRNSEEHIYTYYPDTWKKLGLGEMDLAYRTSFIPDLIQFLDRIYIVALFCSYNLDIVGLNESHKFYDDRYNNIMLDGRPVYHKDKMWVPGYDLKFEDYYGHNLLDFQKFNTIDSLVKTEIIHVLFSEEEISNIESFEMNKNDDDLLHSIILYDTGYDAYKAFIQNQHAFTFKKYSNQIEFISSRYENNGQTFNEPTKIVFDLKSGDWDFGILGSIKGSFDSSYKGKLKFEYEGGSSYILLEQYSNSDNYYLYVERLGEDKSEYYFHIPRITNHNVEISNEHVDISLLSNFFTPLEWFYGDVMTKEVTYYDKNAKQWSDYRDCKTNISIDYQTKTIKLSGTHNEIYKITDCPSSWSIRETSFCTYHSIDLKCINSIGDLVDISFEYPSNGKGYQRQLLVYPSNGVSMGFTEISGHRSILKDKYKIYPSSGDNYMFYRTSYDEEGYGLVKSSGEMPICTPGLFSDFYWKNPKYTNNLVIAEKDGKWGAIDFVDNSNPDGVYGIPFIYDSMEPFDEGKSNATLNGNKVVILATDKVFIPFSELVGKNMGDLRGETILKSGHHIIPGDAGRYIAFKYKEKIGFALDSSEANVLLYPQYDEIYLKDKYMILVSKDGKWGAIPKWLDERCAEISCTYDKMSPFNNGISEVVLNGETFTINMKGERIP